MIAHLTGKVRALTADSVVLDVNGVGYLVHISQRASGNAVIGVDLSIHTSLVVREDAMTLYGFLDSEERDIFLLVQSVTGIGPKVAMAITGALTPQQFAAAISTEDVATIEKIPGIGKKGAQRIVLELKGKLVVTHTESISHQSTPLRGQLLDALMGLGFSARDSDTAISSAFNHCAENGIDPHELSLPELLKLALQSGRR